MNLATLIDDEQYFIQKISKKKTAKKNAANKRATYGMSSGQSIGKIENVVIYLPIDTYYI